MSKMRMPEMNVVRFTESDVIVASNRIYVQQWANKNANDGEILMNDTVILNHPSGQGQEDAFYSLFAAGEAGEYYFHRNSDDNTPYTLGALIQMDNNNTSYDSEVDGWYTYTSTGHFTKQ